MGFPEVCIHTTVLALADILLKSVSCHSDYRNGFTALFLHVADMSGAR